MELMVDAIVSPVLFEEEEDTGLVWKNIDFDERIQADLNISIGSRRKVFRLEGLGV